MRWAGFFGVAAVSLWLAGCASVHNTPVNEPANGSVVDQLHLGFKDVADEDDLLLGVAFSGGGTRAAAFSFGVLSEMDRIAVPRGNDKLLDRLDFISGVSGGAVTAAYYGLKKKEALTDFRERFLLQNAEEGINTTLSLATMGRALGGGINDQQGFTQWLDRNLFHGATYGDFRAVGPPRVWINASDIYNRVPFVFGATAFTAICSDLTKFPLSNAVAASAAVPVAFAPIVVKAYPGTCTDPLPSWITRSAADRNASPMLRSFASAILRYREGKVPFIKLLDGGLVDNYGLSGFTISRESSDTAYGPLKPEQAVRLRRAMFLVVDAKEGLSGDWVRTVDGPTGVDLVKAAIDTTIDASVGASFTAFERTMTDWQNALVKWRCALSAADRKRLGAPANWNCRDVRFFVGRVGFDQLDPARAAELGSVPTRFNLPQQQVDEVIAAGRDALRISPTLRDFLKSM
ncbi:MAG: patatin-like phospholipase family protein [Xanthobacteraceae bacterium]